MTSTDSDLTVLDPVFVVNGCKRGLPWILHALEEGEQMQFNHLRAHQKHAWHLFLVQTAAMLGPTDDWDSRLRAEGDIWDVYPEPGECGFFQPANNIENGYHRVESLEEEDIPGVSANHRAKGHFPDSIDYWLYTLIAAQTINRHETHHRQSVRTSTGYGDRPYVSKVKDLSWSSRFQSDVDLARSMHGGGEGIKFLWTAVGEKEFFGDESGVSFSDCHPLVLDSCRPYRMREGAIYYKTPWPDGVMSTDLHAELEDPWLPIDVGGRGDPTTKGTKETGFTYDVVRHYLVGTDIETPSLQQKLGGDCYFIAQSIAGGQGKSKGIHERVVMIPSEEETLWSDDFEDMSKQYVERAGEAKEAFSGAAAAFFDGEFPGRATHYYDQLDEAIDQQFFPHLFDHFGEEGQGDKWNSHVQSIGEDLLDEMIRYSTNWEARAQAKNVFTSMTA